MPERMERIAAFLDTAGWAGAKRLPIAGDMSTRRYSRLYQDGKTAVLMDADSDMTSFVEMTTWLNELGLSVPEVLQSDACSGLILLEDFGDTSLKETMMTNQSQRAIAFEHCQDVLLAIRDAPPPDLSHPDLNELVVWTELVDAHLPGTDAEALTAFREILLDVLKQVLGGRHSVSLRDFHSENVMWLSDRQGYRKLGLLDYQDAFITHSAYDLMSFLTDARTWISASERQSVMADFLQRTDEEPEAFKLAFAALSAQRNLRILGVFARAGKPLADMQNTFQYFKEALQHPAFHSVRKDTLSALPKALTGE